MSICHLTTSHDNSVGPMVQYKKGELLSTAGPRLHVPSAAPPSRLTPRTGEPQVASPPLWPVGPSPKSVEPPCSLSPCSLPPSDSAQQLIDDTADGTTEAECAWPCRVDLLRPLRLLVRSLWVVSETYSSVMGHGWAAVSAGIGTGHADMTR